MDLATQNHLHTLRELLQYRQSALRAQLHAALMRQGLAPAGSPDGEQQTKDRQELAAVEAALHRLDIGRYGDCLDCGDAIPWARLLAQPSAAHCAHCEAARAHSEA